MIKLISFGYGHGEPPQADITIDLRRKYRNPHHDEDMRELTAMSPPVYQHVMDTKGVPQLVSRVAALASNMDTIVGDVTIAFGCSGGRHRAPAVAMAVADQLRELNVLVAVEHWDIHRPVLPSAKHD